MYSVEGVNEVAKRFRDTGKWRGWYRTLPPKIKLLFDYICDECSHAGVFKEDYDVASFCIGVHVTREDVEKHLATKVIRVDHDKLFIPSFVEFQYGVCPTHPLNPSNNAHLGVVRELERYGIDPVSLKPLTSPFVAPPQELPSPRVGAQDKEKEEDKEKEKEKKEGGVGETRPKTFGPAELLAMWNDRCGTLPKALKLSDKRERQAKARLEDDPRPEHWSEVIIRLAESDFCNGKGGTGWRADFDFLLQPDTHVKALEGKYDNRATGKGSQTTLTLTQKKELDDYDKQMREFDEQMRAAK